MDKPTLFVNSIQIENKSSKQEVFDSRKAKPIKSKIHRLDDVIAFMKLGKQIFVTIITKSKKISGEIKSIDDTHLYINNTKIKITELVEVNINTVK